MRIKKRVLAVRRMKLNSLFFFFFSSRRRHTRFDCDWSSDVCSSDLGAIAVDVQAADEVISDLEGTTVEVRWDADIDVLIGARRHKRRLAKTRGAEIGRASCRERV